MTTKRQVSKCPELRKSFLLIIYRICNCVNTIFFDVQDLVFNVEEVQTIIRDNIELCLGGNTYSHTRAPQWISIITDKTMARLTKLNKPFKYICEYFCYLYEILSH